MTIFIGDNLFLWFDEKNFLFIFPPLKLDLKSEFSFDFDVQNFNFKHLIAEP